MNNNLFEAFNNGLFILPEKSVKFADIPWQEHPVFVIYNIDIFHFLFQIINV